MWWEEKQTKGKGGNRICRKSWISRHLDHGLHHSHSEFHVGGGGASHQAGVADWSVPVRLTAGRKFPEWSRERSLRFRGTRLTGLMVDIRRHCAQMYSDSVAGAESPWKAVSVRYKISIIQEKKNKSHHSLSIHRRLPSGYASLHGKRIRRQHSPWCLSTIRIKQSAKKQQKVCCLWILNELILESIALVFNATWRKWTSPPLQILFSSSTLTSSTFIRWPLLHPTHPQEILKLRWTANDSEGVGFCWRHRGWDSGLCLGQGVTRLQELSVSNAFDKKPKNLPLRWMVTSCSSNVFTCNWL